MTVCVCVYIYIYIHTTALYQWWLFGPVQSVINLLNAELNPIYHLLALLGAHRIFHVSRIRVNVLTGWKVWCVLLHTTVAICGIAPASGKFLEFRSSSLPLCLLSLCNFHFIFLASCAFKTSMDSLSLSCAHTTNIPNEIDFPSNQRDSFWNLTTLYNLQVL